MIEKKSKKTPEKLEVILEALKEKKGKDIVTINLKNVGHAVCDYFVICHGDSTTQVDALSEGVHRKLKTELKIGAHHIEGNENSLWILLDYFDIIVHVFLNEQRSFYKLEELWADGELNRIEDN
jgi:ribosome-associated protein